MEQAKSVINGNPGLFNSDYLRDPAFNERNDVIAGKAKDCLRERRPALGHKRAQFSLKPSRIYPNETLKLTLDVDYLKDPEELFMAYERLENAEREIQKQMGGVAFELNQNNKSTHARHRRPGLLRNNQQRLVRYRHRYSVGTHGNNYHVPSFQGIFEPGSQNLTVETTDKTGPCLASLECELTDSSVVEEKIDDILNELRHGSCEDLEQDVAIPHLRESLQIRPIILPKLSIPDLADNRVADLKSFGWSLSKPGKALSNSDILLKEMHHKTPFKHRQDAGSALRKFPSASPTPPKSPFAPLSSLLKRCSLSRSSVDPFPLLYDDNLSTRNTSVNQEINPINSTKPASLLMDAVAVKTVSLVEDNVGKCYSSSGKSKRDDLGKPSSKINKLLNKDAAVSKTGSVEGTRNCASKSGKSEEDNSKELGFDTNIDSNESLVDIDGDIGHSDMGDGIMDDIVSESNSEVNCACDLEDKEVVASVSRNALDLYLVNPLDQSTILRLQRNAMDECARTSDDGEAERCLQVHEKPKASKASVKQKKDKSYSQRECKNKGLSRRQSLGVAGSSWKSGVRRSTRIKTRPLEYWKGERLVYGRIHESLATVIGVKYMSPGSTDGKPTMKAKSFVSDEHKELWELASLY